MIIKNRTLLAALFVFCLSCSTSGDTLPEKKETEIPDKPLPILDLFEKEGKSNSDELYFFDSRGKSFANNDSLIQYGKADETLVILLDELFGDLGKREKPIKVVVEIADNGGELTTRLIEKSNDYINSKKELINNSSPEDFKSVISKISNKEVNPFHIGSRENMPVNTESLLLYIRKGFLGKILTLKASLITMEGVVFASTSGKIDFGLQQTAKMEWLSVKVPKSNSSEFITYNIMERPISEKEFIGHGSENRPITNVSFEEVNKFCGTVYEGALLSSPYVFEFARRTFKLKKPDTPAVEEIIAPIDLEDRDEIHFREKDHLVSSEDDVSTMIIFRWDTEKYFAVSSSYKSPQLTFRCYR